MYINCILDNCRKHKHIIIKITSRAAVNKMRGQLFLTQDAEPPGPEMQLPNNFLLEINEA